MHHVAFALNIRNIGRIVISKISDEIEQLRATGKSYGDIRAMTKAAIGKTVVPEYIAAH